MGMQHQQQGVRASVAAMMARQPSAMDAALIRSGAPMDLKDAFALLPARKERRQ